MQERWSTSSAKLVQVENGLPEVEEYVPSKKDGNANKNYVKSVLCTKVSLFLLLLCLVGLSSYLLWQTPQRPLDDDDEDIPENLKSRDDEVTPSWLEDKIWEYDRNVATETQHDDSNDSNDPSGEVEHSTHAADDTEENTSEISSKNEQLDALVQKFMSENSISKLNATVIPGHDNMDPLSSDLVSLLVHIALRGELGMAEKPKEPVEVEEEEEEEEEEEKGVSNEEEKQSTDSDSTTEMDSDSYDSEIHLDDDYYQDYEDIWGYSRGRRLREHRILFLLG
ncbi:uncharacterized protein LOC143259863 isoform X1 [Megalopta genalis]|uniref:uncharacterized protein LOC143259863 isoform X1 n=1 Tax=Megalopta genalis TaxID=115081 RepID=UPI003FD0EC76